MTLQYIVMRRLYESVVVIIWYIQFLKRAHIVNFSYLVFWRRVIFFQFKRLCCINKIYTYFEPWSEIAHNLYIIRIYPGWRISVFGFFWFRLFQQVMQPICTYLLEKSVRDILVLAQHRETFLSQVCLWIILFDNMIPIIIYSFHRQCLWIWYTRIHWFTEVGYKILRLSYFGFVYTKTSLFLDAIWRIWFIIKPRNRI